MSAVRIELVDAASTDQLRRAVLRADLPPDVPMTAIAPPDALHLGALAEDGGLVGTCVLFPAPYPTRPDEAGTWQLRGMAVDAAVQGSGVGRLLLSRVDEEVVARGGRLLWCNARVTAIPFYERSGWVAEGEVFLTEQTRLPHRRMSREPPRSATSSD